MRFGLVMSPNGFKVETVRLPLARLAREFSGFRLVQISDIHMGGWMNLTRFQHVAELIAAQRPEILLITGDFVFGRGFPVAARQWVADLGAVLAPLAASVPTFAVLGNHDYRTSPEAVREMLCRSGVVDLTNAVFTLRRGSGLLHLCGLDDVRHGDVRLNDVLAQIRASGAAILLVHEPDFADISAATGRFDLQVSGHSHGGQVVVPFYGPPRLPPRGQKYPAGLYKIGDMFEYTNRGVGMDRFPIRFNCPPEITVFELEDTG